MRKIVLVVFIICAKLVNAQTCFAPPTYYSTSNGPTAVVEGDFNMDGKIDLAVSNLNSANVNILLGTGTGGFGSATNFPVAASSQPLFLCTADFNEDGFLDIATANSALNNVSVLLGTGTGTFGSFNNYATPGTPFSVCAADFNGDGHIDLAVTNENLTNASVLLGSGTGSFGTPFSFAAGTNPYGICAGDFNNDGKTDLAVSNDGSNNVSVLINTITGTVTPTFTTSATISMPTNPRSIIAVDMNLDGKLDLVTANEGASNVSNLYGNGNGTFNIGPTAMINPSGTSQPRCVINGDFNGDGHQDLATADFGNFSPYYASVVMNGLGTGQNLSLGGAAQNPHGICSADFNGDGSADLAIASESSNNVAILLNNYPVVSFSGDTAICTGKTATIIASGANTYTWSPSVTVANTSTSSETVTATPTANVTYTVTANNSSCGLTGTFLMTLTVNTAPTISITGVPSTSVCPGVTSTLTANGASTYTWSTTDTTASIMVNPVSYTGYTVTATSAAGCVGTKTTSISVFSAPVVTVNSPTICATSAATLTASGANTYTWNTNATGATITPSPTGSTSYTVTGTDGNGCVGSGISNVTVNQLPSVQINGATNDFNFICAGSSVVLNASGANTYTWSTNAQGNHITVTPANGDLFGVTGTDVNGCKNQATSSYSLHTLPTVTVNSATVCAGTTVTLLANGANTYTWSNSATTNSIVVTPTTSANYTVTGTDANTCTNTAVASISAPANPAPDICMVTTDSASLYNYNIVYWDKTLYTNADSFIVYRFDVLANSYFKIGAVSKDSLSAFMDTARHAGSGGSVHNGDPNYTSWKYKLAVRDTCGNISAQSPFHQTVFLQNQNNGNFNVSQYVIETGQANPVTGYFLFRDDLGNNNYQLLIPISGTSATDPAYASYPNANYRVDILGFNCNPTLRLAGGNNPFAAKVRSHSNINNNRTVGINKVAAVSQVKIYPNPATTNITIQAGAELGNVVIYNALGEVVMQLNSKNTQEQIDISKLATGIYTIAAKNSFTKLIKE